MKIDEEQAEIQKRSTRFLEDLQEFHGIASARVFVVRKIGTKVHAMDVGCGDFYSNYGAVREWLMEQDERCRVRIRNESGAGFNPLDPEEA